MKDTSLVHGHPNRKLECHYTLEKWTLWTAKMEVDGSDDIPDFNSGDLGRFQLFKIPGCDPASSQNRSWFFVIIDVWCPNVTPSSRGRASDWKLFRKEGWFVDPFVWDSPRFWGTWLFYLPYSQRQFFFASISVNGLIQDRGFIRVFWKCRIEHLVKKTVFT